MANPGFQLVMRKGPTPGKVFPLEQNELHLGRDLNNEIVVNDAEVSRRHVRFVAQGGGYVVEDLGSTNGTFVNGRRLTGPYLLQPGETVTIGEQVALVYEVVQAYDPNATVVSPAARPAAPQSGYQPSPFQQQVPPPPPQQAYRPQPAPVIQAPPPNYAGQVPVSPVSEPLPQKKAPKTWLIILIIVLALICICAVGFIIFDSLNLYCTVLPFLFPACQ